MNQPQLIGSSGDSLREAFGKALCHWADHFAFAVFDGDVAGGTGVHHFRKAFPQRFFQCGIAEQNMMALAAGFARETGEPAVVTTFAVFCMRAIEQARLSIAYAKANVKIVASHPGMEVGPDGASAQCLEDLAMFRAIPNMTVIAPVDPLQVHCATRAILEHPGPVYMRTGRSPAQRFLEAGQPFVIGKGQLLMAGHDVTLVACGSVAFEALLALKTLRDQGTDAGLVLMPTLKPLDTELLIHQAQSSGAFVTVEDHNQLGGLGSAVAEALARSVPCPIEMVGVADRFGESGEGDELRHHYGLTSPAIVQAAYHVMARKRSLD
ncbi:MAG: transketolase family protein [Acidobacteria bacterium]|nr:transketolase family protein [Acidobacteriota bacterium]MCB9397873.1 transketolase family protein [Acidobacteriota bacterium]